MGERPGLYEYLSVAVPDFGSTEVDRDAAEGTRYTFTKTEAYDGDSGLGPSIGSAESTYITRSDNETFDDDPGIEGLGDSIHVSTDRTAMPHETYDDNVGLDTIGIPRFRFASDSSVFTKADIETHDDSGLGGLGYQ